MAPRRSPCLLNQIKCEPAAEQEIGSKRVHPYVPGQCSYLFEQAELIRAWPSRRGGEPFYLSYERPLVVFSTTASRSALDDPVPYQVGLENMTKLVPLVEGWGGVRGVWCLVCQVEDANDGDDGPVRMRRSPPLFYILDSPFF